MAKMKTPAGKKPQSKAREEEEGGEEGGEEGDESGEEGEDPQEANRRINAIVTSRVKREMKGVLADLATMKGMLEKLATPKKEEGEEGEEIEEGEEGKDKAEADSKMAKKFSRLEKQLAEEKAARTAAEKAREEEAAKSKTTEMKNIFGSILTEFGCTDPRLNKAALVILEEEGIMTRDEDGKIKFKGVDKYGIETLFEPKVGLKAWIAGDGKSFVPAVDAGGSGQGGSGQGLGNSRFTAKDLKGLTPRQIAEINFDRSFQGLPPLPGTEGNE
jgi:hypothetical protein